MAAPTESLPAENKRVRITRWGVVRVALGLLLLTAAGLKTHGYVLDPVSQDSFLSSPRLQVAVIELEIILGLWLLSGFAARAAWLAALGFFGVLAAASFYMGWEGQASCGCFGKIEVNPWVTFGLDVAICTAIGFCRPVKPTTTARVNWFGDAVKTVAAAFVLLSLVAATFFLLVERPLDALARWRGDNVTISPNPVFAGEGKAGEVIEFTVQVRNHTDHPVRLIGGTFDCTCSAVRDLPIIIPSRSERAVKVFLKLGKSPGIFHRPFELYTTAPRQFYVSGNVSVRVRSIDEVNTPSTDKTKRHTSALVTLPQGITEKGI